MIQNTINSVICEAPRLNSGLHFLFAVRKSGSTHVKFGTNDFRWLHDEGKRRQIFNGEPSI